jgi:acetyltransferase-like isoleucine patch superfamily enzyme
VKFLTRSLWMFIRACTNLPARMKGASIGNGSMMRFPYDCLLVSLNGLKIGKNVSIGRRAWISLPSDSGTVSIGDGVSIGREVVIACIDSIAIGAGTLISYRVSILDHNHVVDGAHSPALTQLRGNGPIVLGENCFVGANTFILSGVHLGESCVVGAGSVVTHSFPAYSIIAGIPARLIGTVSKAS